MNNAAKSSTALLSTHSSSSSENDNLEAAKETAQKLAFLQQSINGLVGVARQSHETQQLNMLHSQRMQLEDHISKLDESCMDLELKCLDSIGLSL